MPITTLLLKSEGRLERVQVLYAIKILTPEKGSFYLQPTLSKENKFVKYHSGDKERFKKFQKLVLLGEIVLWTLCFSLLAYLMIHQQLK